MTIKLHISDKDGFTKGMIEARAGLITYMGEIVRVSTKSIWVRTKNGSDYMLRAHDGALPSVTFGRLSQSDRRALGI